MLRNLSDSSDAHSRLISLLTLHALVHGLAGEQKIDLALKLFSSIVANGINISQPGQDSDRALEEVSVLKGIASKPNSTKTVKNLELYVLTLLTTITHPSGSSTSLNWFTSDVSTDVRSKYHILISPIYERFRPPSMTVFSICKSFSATDIVDRTIIISNSKCVIRERMASVGEEARRVMECNCELTSARDN